MWLFNKRIVDDDLISPNSLNIEFSTVPLFLFLGHRLPCTNRSLSQTITVECFSFITTTTTTVIIIVKMRPSMRSSLLSAQNKTHFLPFIFGLRNFLYLILIFYLLHSPYTTSLIIGTVKPQSETNLVTSSLTRNNDWGISLKNLQKYD